MPGALTLSELAAQGAIEATTVIDTAREFADCFDFSIDAAKLTASEKESLLTSLTTEAMNSAKNSIAHRAACLKLLKVLARSRGDLSPMYADSFLPQLLPAATEALKEQDGETLALQAVHVCINCCILDMQKGVTKILSSTRVHECIDTILITAKDTLLLASTARVLFFLTVMPDFADKVNDQGIMDSSTSVQDLSKLNVNTNELVTYNALFRLFLQATEDDEWYTSQASCELASRCLQTLFNLSNAADNKLPPEMQLGAALLGNKSNMERDTTLLAERLKQTGYLQRVILRVRDVLHVPLRQACPHYEHIRMAAASKPSPLSVKNDVINVMLHFPNDRVLLAPLLRDPEKRFFRGLQDYAVCTLRCPGNNKAATLCPLLMVLFGVAKGSRVSCHALKHFVFGALAERPEEYVAPADPQSEAMDPPEFEESEKIKGQESPRFLFTQLVTSLDSHVKLIVQQLLFALCDEDPQEYIRLLGFGNAVGLLAQSGDLPGMLGLGQGQVRQRELTREELERMSQEAMERRARIEAEENASKDDSNSH